MTIGRVTDGNDPAVVSTLRVALENGLAIGPVCRDHTLNRDPGNGPDSEPKQAHT